MTLAELRTIVKYVEIDPKQKVWLRVKLPEGKIAHADIESVKTYSDGLVLNVNIE